MKATILIDKLTKKYGECWAIQDLNLTVSQGEIFGFLGPNGAGKTTTIRILTTLTKPTSGNAWIANFNVLEEPGEVKKIIGVVQQHLTLDLDLTLKENMELHARFRRINSPERNKRINELLDYVGLSKQGDQMVRSLSGGMKRSAMIASALVHQPKVLFLDEPTVGLDVQTRRSLWDLIRRLNNDGTTIFLTTHYIEEAEALCHQVGIIHKGHLIALGSPTELRQKIGLFTVETLENNMHTRYHYFSSRETATSYVQSLSSDVKTILIRESNLEDTFVELTGEKVGGN